MNKTTLLLGGAVIAVLVIVGSWMYGAWQVRKFHDAVAVAVRETTPRVDAALSGEPAPAGLEADAQAVEGRIARLQGMGSKADRALYEATELFLIESRELLRRQAQVRRSRAEWVAARSRLDQRMRGAGTRGQGWNEETARVSKAVSQANFDQRVALQAYVKLLGDAGTTRAALKARAPQLPLPSEELRAKAEREAREALDRLRR